MYKPAVNNLSRKVKNGNWLLSVLANCKLLRGFMAALANCQPCRTFGQQGRLQTANLLHGCSGFPPKKIQGKPSFPALV
jgi:hypothetical protein